MNVFGIRSMMATALSLWLGVLACLLGCATPAKAAGRASQAVGVTCPERANEAGDSCCQHGHAPGTSEKSRHHAMTCCPTETALIQKQSPTLPVLTSVFVAVLTFVHLDASPFDFDRSHSGAAIAWQSGRDILQQVHVLRI